MDFGVGGLGNLVSSTNSDTCCNNNGSFAVENGDKRKWYGSGYGKQERASVNEEDLRDFKAAKTSAYGEAMLKIPLQRSNSSNGGNQQMLSFSSPDSQSVTFAGYNQTATAFSRNTGHGFGGMNAGGMHGVISGIKGPFTPSQWMELEHQALIYKYISANVPIPSYLLNPIRKALESAGFSSFSGFRSNAFGWGAFHLGFSSTDPEPGRCRRTDGKKWRCSRDAVADQKYCERHMNRGRHRSRKPVEGQPGHPASGTTTTNGKLMAMASSKPAAVVPAGGISNSISLSHHQKLSDLQSGSSNHPSGIPNISRNMQNEESSSPEFGLVYSDSLLNPLNRSSSLVGARNYSESLNDHENKSKHGLRQFMDDWPKKQSDPSGISWPDVDPDRTQLSISIPMVTSDFMSSTSSPTNEKLAASPPRLSSDLEMGLGMGNAAREHDPRQTNWVPISWEPSMGGPLGEVLHSTSNNTGDSKNTKALNLMERWDSSQRSSPTGVLQRGSFGSLSNSSGGSSPRAESSKILDGASLCNGLISPGLFNPSMPAL